MHSAALAAKPWLVVLTKRDLVPEHDPLPALTAEGAFGVVAVSAAAGQGIEELLEQLWRIVHELRVREDDSPEAASERGADDTWDLDWGETDSGDD
jgi:50S ribosomal subunit-associated GTPase HflX